MQNPNREESAEWQRQIDRIAAELDELRRQGVPIAVDAAVIAHGEATGLVFDIASGSSQIPVRLIT